MVRIKDNPALSPYTTLFRSQMGGKSNTSNPPITGYHAHVYYEPATRDRAATLREQVAERLRSPPDPLWPAHNRDRKSTRLNSSHSQISYAVFCLKKKNLDEL